MEQEIKKQRDELTRLSNAVNNTQLELEGLKRDIKVRSAELISLDAEIESRKKDLDALAVDKDFLDAEIESCVKEKKDVQKENDVLLAQRNQDIALCEERKAVLVSNISELEHAFAEKEAAQQKDLLAVESHIATVKQDLKSATDELKSARSSVESTGVAQVSADKALAEVRDELTDLVKEILEKQFQSDTLANLVAITSEEKVALEQEIVLKKAEITGLHDDFEVVSDKVAQLKEELDILDKEKFSFLEAKKALAQKEIFIRNLYKDAGVTYPE